MFRELANASRVDSLSNRMRQKRFRVFEEVLRSLPKPVRIIDLGGTNVFWENRGLAESDAVRVTTVNLESEPAKHSNIDVCVGDATNLCEFQDMSFDLAFSNSVIEHLFTWENQILMAREIQRVATAHWIQTPNYWFPMEPHFLIPGWQWLPLSVRLALIRRWRCGWRGPCSDKDAAIESVSEVRLLTRWELRLLFPKATLLPERFLGLVKSWTAIGGLKFPVASTPAFRAGGFRAEEHDLDI